MHEVEILAREGHSHIWLRLQDGENTILISIGRGGRYPTSANTRLSPLVAKQLAYGILETTALYETGAPNSFPISAMNSVIRVETRAGEHPIQFSINR